MKNKNKKKAEFFKSTLEEVGSKEAKRLEQKYKKIQDKSYYRGKKK